MIRGPLVAAVAGAAVMALEVLASRWLAPSFGFTLTTWAWVIAVTLAAGALGAFLGGRWAGRGGDPCRTVGRLLGVAFAVVAAESFAAPAITDAFLRWPAAWGAGAAAAVLLAPAVVALGAVVPLLVAGGPAGESAGRRAGTLIAASTGGSLAGVLGAALLFVPSFGLASTARGVAIVLGGTALIARRPGPAGAGLVVVGVVALLAAPSGAPVDGPDRVVRETPYGRLELRADGAGGFSLFVDGINQATGSLAFAGRGSLLSRGQHLELLPYLRPEATTALQVGLGGALVANVLAAYGIEVESVEIDPVLVEVVRNRIGHRGPVTVADGRRAIRLAERRWDLIVLDVFRGEGVPAHLMTREAFAEARARLTADGVLAVHLIGAPDHVVVGAVARTLASVFPKTLAVRERLGGGLQHLVLFASDAPLVVHPDADLVAFGWVGNEIFEPPAGSAPLLTDDLNPLSRLNEAPARALREASMR